MYSRILLNALIIATLWRSARLPFKTVISIYMPCSVKAYGRYRKPPQVEVKFFDLKIESISSLVN